MKPSRLLTALALLPALHAASTTTWELNSYEDFLRGKFSGVSLSRDGRLTLAPQLETLFASDQAAVWCMDKAPDGTLYLGTGHRGRIYKVDPSGKASLFWTANEPEVFALAIESTGVVYAATSPNGKVYRIEKGQASEYFAPGTTYIWSLAIGKDGSLYAGTGAGGRIFRITGPGKGEVWYDTGQSHVTALAVDAQGRLLAGTEPNGILYRISAKDKAFVLYDANLPEIRSIVPAPDGSIYAAALGGAVARQAGSVPASSLQTGVGAVVATSTSITVTDAQAGIDLKKSDPLKQPTQVTPQVTSTFAASTEMLGVERSAVYRIHPDNTVETLWTSKEENAYDLVASNSGLLFSTDVQGRIYQLTPDRKVTLLQQTNEAQTTRLMETSAGLVAATGNIGKLFRLRTGIASSGTYESPVHDAGSVARWGRISWRAEGAEGLKFRTRTGNSARPDRTWSEWSQPMTDPSGSPISSPNARYIQWSVEFSPVQKGSPALESVTVAYLPQNTPPVIQHITVTTHPSAGAPAKPATTNTGSMSPYSITVTDTGEPGATSGTSRPTQVLTRTASQHIAITWQGEDYDGDRLLYSLYFRGEGEQNWKLLRAWFPENTYQIEGDVLADGKYFFRVVASDRSNNAGDTAREAEAISAPVVIDNTPPVVTVGTARRAGSLVEFEMRASDSTSSIRRAEYSVDASPWIPVEAADGVTDSPQEEFSVRIDGLSPGEHLIVLRVFDSAGNAGLAKVVVR
jgi:Predicted periplasmic ligand-binding sensor domain